MMYAIYMIFALIFNTYGERTVLNNEHKRYSIDIDNPLQLVYNKYSVNDRCILNIILSDRYIPSIRIYRENTTDYIDIHDIHMMYDNNMIVYEIPYQHVTHIDIHSNISTNVITSVHTQYISTINTMEVDTVSIGYRYMSIIYDAYNTIDNSSIMMDNSTYTMRLFVCEGKIDNIHVTGIHNDSTTIDIYNSSYIHTDTHIDVPILYRSAYVQVKVDVHTNGHITYRYALIQSNGNNSMYVSYNNDTYDVYMNDTSDTYRYIQSYIVSSSDIHSISYRYMCGHDQSVFRYTFNVSDDDRYGIIRRRAWNPHSHNDTYDSDINRRSYIDIMDRYGLYHIYNGYVYDRHYDNSTYMNGMLYDTYYMYVVSIIYHNDHHALYSTSPIIHTYSTYSIYIIISIICIILFILYIIYSSCRTHTPPHHHNRHHNNNSIEIVDSNVIDSDDGV